MGMDRAHQQTAPGPAGAVGDAVVVGTALAWAGAGGRHGLEAELRSQNLLFTLPPLPLLVGPAAAYIIGPVKEFVGDAHDCSRYRGLAALGH